MVSGEEGLSGLLQTSIIVQKCPLENYDRPTNRRTGVDEGIIGKLQFQKGDVYFSLLTNFNLPLPKVLLVPKLFVSDLST